MPALRSFSVPSVSIQPDILDSIDDVRNNKVNEEFFWINSTYTHLNKETTEFSKFKISKSNNNNNDITFNNENENSLNTFKQIDDHNFSFSSQAIKTSNGINQISLKLPHDVYKSQHNSSINSLDISPFGDQFVTGDNEGLVRIGSMRNGSTLKTFSGHFLYITCVKFFPSGKVILSAGGDYTIKIWDAITGDNPRTFIGHKGVVTDLSIIERGKNFLSSSNDGYIRLWECSTAKTISTFGKLESQEHDAITKLSLSKKLTTNNNIEDSELEFGVSDKIVFAGYESGNISQFDLRTKKNVSKISSSSSITSLIYPYLYSSTDKLISGHSDGTIKLWDLRFINNNQSNLNSNSDEPFSTIKISNSSIIDLNLLKDKSNNNKLIISSSIGIVEEFNYNDLLNDLSSNTPLFYYCGFNESKVNSIKSININGEIIRICGDKDGKIFKYID